MPGPVFVFLPAMGVAVRFYEPFLDALADACAATVMALDLPGQGTSPLRARAGDDFGYREVVEELIPQALREAARRHPQRRVVLIGHSLGGQLATLSCAALAAQIDALVLIAAGTAHWRAWPEGNRLRAGVTVHAIALASALLPWYPGERLGFGGNQSRRFMRDWSFNALRGRYRLEGSARSTADLVAQLAGTELPVLALSIREDPVAPPGALDELLAHIPRAPVAREVVTGVEWHAPWRRHFSWARQPSGIDARIAQWLTQLGRTVPAASTASASSTPSAASMAPAVSTAPAASRASGASTANAASTASAAITANACQASTSALSPASSRLRKCPV